MLYFIHIGGQHVVPAANRQEMQGLWALALAQLLTPDLS
jgi:hypothetical protein